MFILFIRRSLSNKTEDASLFLPRLLFNSLLCSFLFLFLSERMLLTFCIDAVTSS